MKYGECSHESTEFYNIITLNNKAIEYKRIFETVHGW